jgi:hypothetical protein
MNRGVAQQSPWIAFLRQRGTLEEIAQKLRDAGEEYRRLYGVKPKYKTTAERRKTKIERALAAIKDAEIHGGLRAEFGDKFRESYIADAVKTLQKEQDHINTLIQWQGAPQQPLPQPNALEKKASGYGLREGLGYGYGYFY